MKVLKVLSEKIEQHKLKEASFLVACSGGPDSVALLLALASLGHSVCAVYINHRTRPECEQEEVFVKTICDELRIRYFSYSLPKALPLKNKEEFWRKERHKIFEKICKEENISTLALGHHQGDNQETVCKRFFEGASLTNLQGMLSFAKQGEIHYFRPFLSLSKNALLLFLQEREQEFCKDASNNDLQYTRNRIRTFLDQQGAGLVKKNIRKGIQQQIEEAAKLLSYLERKSYEVPFEEKLFALGGTLYFKDRKSDMYEMEYILRRFLKKFQIFLPKGQIEKIALALKGDDSNKIFFKSGIEIIVDRMCAYVFSPPLSSYSFVLKEAKQAQKTTLSFPEQLLSGVIECTFSEKPTHLTPLKGRFLIQGREGSLAREKRKYPASFKKLPLGVWKEQVLVADLYSGLGLSDQGFAYKVHLERQ